MNCNFQKIELSALPVSTVSGSTVSGRAFRSCVAIGALCLAVIGAGVAERAVAIPVSSKDDDLVIETKGGLSVRTADGEYGFKLNGRVLYDYITYEGAFNRNDDDRLINNSIINSVNDAAASNAIEEALTADEVSSVNDFDVRGVRLTLSGNATQDWHFKLGYRFNDGGEFLDAYVRYTGFGNWAHLTLGKQKVPFGLDALTNLSELTALERNIVSLALAANRQEGISLAGYNDVFSYKLGTYELDSDTLLQASERVNTEIDSLVAARFTVHPLETRHGSFHLGWAYQRYNIEAGTPALATVDPTEHEFILDGVTQLDAAGTTEALTVSFVRDGALLRPIPTEVRGAHRLSYFSTLAFDGVRDLSFEVAGSVGPVYVQFEYANRKFEGTSGSVDNSVDSYSAQVSWAITGERRSYDSALGLYRTIKPKRSIGAWEVYFRLSELDTSDNWDNLDAVSSTGGREVNYGQLYQSATIGVNWYINQNMRLNLNIVQADVEDYVCSRGLTSASNALINCRERDTSQNSGDAVGLRFQYIY